MDSEIIAHIKNGILFNIFDFLIWLWKYGNQVYKFLLTKDWQLVLLKGNLAPTLLSPPRILLTYQILIGDISKTEEKIYDFSLGQHHGVARWFCTWRTPLSPRVMIW